MHDYISAACMDQVFVVELLYVNYSAFYLVSIAITVEITVLSDVGGTPSLYLGATATLVCHAQDTVGPLSYHWSSTSNDFFAYNSTAMFNKKTLLSAGDAGNHTCSVTDAHGNTGHATLEMKFEGSILKHV